MNQFALTSPDPWCNLGWMLVGFLVMYYVVPDVKSRRQGSYDQEWEEE